MKTHENPPSVLLLEDNQDLAEEIIYFLQNKGLSIRHSGSLTTVLSIIQQQCFDVLLLDRLLPEGDSLDFFSLIKQKHFGKIICISALTDCSERIAGVEAGADLYLTKPVNMEELFAYINHYVQGQKKPEFFHKKDKPIWKLEGDVLITPNGIRVMLTIRESLILNVLLKSEPLVVDRNTLIGNLGEDVGNFDYRRLDSALYRMRKKVHAESGFQLPVKTYSRYGYCWQV